MHVREIRRKGRLTTRERDDSISEVVRILLILCRVYRWSSSRLIKLKSESGDVTNK